MSETELEAELKKVITKLDDRKRFAIEIRHCIYTLEAQKRELEKKLFKLKVGKIL